MDALDPECYNNARQLHVRRYYNIMKTIRFLLQPLLDLFDRLRAVTMPEMKSALGTDVDVTVFRKLAQLPYRTSYSHRGRFYTLDSIARFDDGGLWFCRGAWFSRQGALLDTVETVVTAAPAGYFVDELETLLHVSVKDALRQLVLQRRLHRQPRGALYFYAAQDRTRRQEQWAARQALLEARDPEEEKLRATIVLFYSLLDEQQRRLYAGLESIQRGHGGDQKMAECLGLDVETVADGANCWPVKFNGTECVGRVRGGRGPKKNTRPLEALGRFVAGGDRGRPDGPTQKVDRQAAATNCHRVGPTGYYRLSPDRAPALGYVGLCAAFQ